MNNESCQRCCANCRFAMPVEGRGEPLLVCPYRHERRGRLAVVEPEEGCPAFRERVRPKDRPGQESCAIPLVNMDGLCALVDAADYEWLSRCTWRAISGGGDTFYAYTRCQGKLCYMHRMIMNPPAGMVVDHKNRDGLDNHRINLRNATRRQNSTNRAWDAGVSGFRGVYPCGDKCPLYRAVRRSGGGGAGLRPQGDRAARGICLSELSRGGREADRMYGRQGEGVPGGRGPCAADATRVVSQPGGGGG